MTAALSATLADLISLDTHPAHRRRRDARWGRRVARDCLFMQAIVRRGQSETLMPDLVVTAARRLRRDSSGSVALIFGLSLPALILMVLAAVELRALAVDRARLQELADAAALNTAGQMRVGANAQLLARARAATHEQARSLTAKLETVDVGFVEEIDGRSGVEVSLVARRMSFFGNLLPPGGFVIRATAVAQQLGATPLCVLTLSESSGSALHMQHGEIVARACLTHSNRDIQLTAQGAIDAAARRAAPSRAALRLMGDPARPWSQTPWPGCSLPARQPAPPPPG